MPILERVLEQSLSQQSPEGYWWYTLEANETISSGAIQLQALLEHPAGAEGEKICRHMLDRQRADGSWGIYHDAPADLSTTVECYFALKLAGFDPQHPQMEAARKIILEHGGLAATRVFTKIHLALFGVTSWDECPAMPPQLILAPKWFPLNPYEFSSWARASIIPLLVLMHQRYRTPTSLTPNFLQELVGSNGHSLNSPPLMGGGRGRVSQLSWQKTFLLTDKVLKKIPLPATKTALARCERWIRDHLGATEDIWPAMFYSILALKARGHDQSDPTIQKGVAGLKSFQHEYVGGDVPSLPRSFAGAQDDGRAAKIHQQCCVSPVWDTPWMGVALLDAGVPADHPAILSSARWLLSKQITERRGDWSIKRPKAKPGGWSFEFENEFFPDVDDTIQVLMFLNGAGLPDSEKEPAIRLGLDWILAMQSSNGGWAAFDVNNTRQLVNKIPFSDHGACLDLPCADLTGRMLELWGSLGRDPRAAPMQRALRFIRKNQLADGSWEGRWGVNYIYGTWAVLQGLQAIGTDMSADTIRRAVVWLKSVQHADGGWGESPEGYVKKQFVDWHRSVPSQTAWGLMGLIAGGEAKSPAVKRGLDFLSEHCRADGTWEEQEHTGTGFPGHFYIRYHGYRHYFPLLALGRAKKAGVNLSGISV